MSENGVENVETDEYNENGNSALDWEIFDILCREDLGLTVSFNKFLLEIHCIFNSFLKRE